MDKEQFLTKPWYRSHFLLIGALIAVSIPGIWWQVRPDPLPKGGNHTAAMVEVLRLLDDAGSDRNYFTRKLALAPLHLKVDQLSDYKVTEDFVGPIKREYGNRLFSRKEWLGF
jgi:hypothetical protein